MSMRIAVAILFSLSLAAGAAFSAPGSGAQSASKCKVIRGHVTTRTATGDCPSPIALCAEGQFYGAVKGDLFLVVTSLTPTQDTPTTGVYTYTADDTVRTREGEIYTKDAGALNLTPGGTGDDVSVATITGGTGAYAGATGNLRISGTFTETGGEFSYEGEVCTP